MGCLGKDGGAQVEGSLGLPKARAGHCEHSSGFQQLQAVPSVRRLARLLSGLDCLKTRASAPAQMHICIMQQEKCSSPEIAVDKAGSVGRNAQCSTHNQKDSGWKLHTDEVPRSALQSLLGSSHEAQQELNTPVENYTSVQSDTGPL